MPNLKFSAFALLLAGLVFTIAPRPAAAADDAADFVRQLGAEAQQLQQVAGLSDAERGERLADLLRTRFALHRMARFTLGRYWRDLSAEERDHYLNVFEAFVVDAAVGNLRRYADFQVEVEGQRPSQGGDSVVRTTLRADGAEARVDWRVGRTDDGLKIVDIVVEGASLAVTRRSEFAAVIRSNGGRANAVITALQQKVRGAG